MKSFQTGSLAGFTLIEVLVALAILAMSGIALMSNVGQATADLGKLNDKVVALGIAEYAINTVLIQEDFPELGSDQQNITLADREWSVELSISETPNEKVRRIDALVRPEGEVLARQEYATVLLSAFRTDMSAD
ncbi:MAG: type II secretion system minor pseudopilin GspI [Gammaproteobacteria bacterium]|nr:type II secretion system minor pseudopilin GspI [Gammaproteobacteria bacterium]NND39931.1 type II secretion system minor pseudopilin GspI [Pseudomonadales bacterium]MBT8151640.1 type II secretion system minor pseudopilin GspI [Gammaproteobacteria bacterium]NNL10206.1 type II secretion system minor pseudopilin GspI [Pseudomonadales bacterium]NNM10668.1 type II secretion system minor pseudopilin GspI [Pseudomonadales bacterium]